MAFAIGAANAPSLGDVFNPLSSRMDDSILHARNTSSPGNNTVNMFIDSTSDSYEYGASIVSVSACETTVYALQCTSAPAYVGLSTCGPNGAVITVTVGPSTYAGSYSVTTTTLGSYVIATAAEHCALDGTTEAACTATIIGAVDGTTTSSSTTETLAGSSYRRFDVAITAGADKTASQSCSATQTGAAAIFNTKNVAIWVFAGFLDATSLLTMS